MAAGSPTTSDVILLEELRRAVRGAPAPVLRIEVGIALSIALGRQRPATTCGGCAVPLEFDGIPAATVPSAPGPFRLILATGENVGARRADPERGWAGSSP